MSQSVPPSSPSGPEEDRPHGGWLPPQSASPSGFGPPPTTWDATQAAQGPQEPSGPGGPPPARADGLPNWPWWSPFLAAAAGLLAAVIGITAITLIAGLFGADVSDTDNLPPGITIAGTIVQDAAFVIAAIATVWLLAGRPTPHEFGVKGTRPLAAIGWTVVVFAAFLVVAAVWSAVFEIDEPDPLPNELGADESTAALIGVAFLVTVVAPFAEEFFFRGYLFTSLRAKVGVWVAMPATGIIFGAVHAGSSKAVYLVPLAGLGIGLCALYLLTKSILPCIALHSINNTIALGTSQKDWGATEVLICMLCALTILAVVTIPLARSKRLNTPASPRAWDRPAAPPPAAAA